jgi:hypothetical protein
MAVVAAGAAVLYPSRASALDLNKHFTVGFRLGDYLPADRQEGGFRFFGTGAIGAPGTHAVEIAEVPVPTLTLGYGVARLGKKVQLSLELEVSRFKAEVGDETGFHDPDASVRVPLPSTPNPGEFVTGQTGDEEFVNVPLGDITMTPILVNALFHWTGKGAARGDFYCGVGAGVILADFKPSDIYVAFASDRDGTSDVHVGEAFATSVKLGSNVSLSRHNGWMLYFEAEFITTALFSSEAQVSWPGLDYFAGTQNVDADHDNVDDTFGLPADYRLMDPGNVRMDGAIAGIGVKYRFGGKKSAAGPAAATQTGTPSEPAKP